MRLNFFILHALFFLTSVSTASAASIQWSSQLPNYASFASNGTSNTRCVPRLIAPHLTITYTATAVTDTGTNACGATLLKGQRVTFSPHTLTSNDIYWFATGYYYDSPYGDPVQNALPPSIMCDSKNIYAYNFKVTATSRRDLYGTISVHPPTATLSDISSHFDCDTPLSDGTVTCTAKSAGSVSATTSFSSTYAKPYAEQQVPGKCTEKPWSTLHTYSSAKNLFDGTGVHACNGKGDSTIQVPAQTLSCPITVIDEDPDNEKPVITSAVVSGTCVAGSDTSFSVSGSDADNDAIRFWFDWNNDHIFDTPLPSSGFAPSPASLSVSHEFALGGAKTVNVLVEDSKLSRSNPQTISVTCDPDPNPDDEVLTGGDNDTGGSGDDGSGTGGGSLLGDITLRVHPPLIQEGEVVAVHWQSTHMKSCEVTSNTTSDRWTTLQSVTGGNASSPLLAETEFTLRCVGDDDNIYIKKKKVKVQAKEEEV